MTTKYAFIQGWTAAALVALGMSSSGYAQERDQNKLGEMSGEQSSAEITTERRVVKREKHRIPTITYSEKRADINRMSAQDFALFGVPENVAQSIVQYRSQNGQFKSTKDLTNVPGMDQEWLKKNMEKFGTVPESQAHARRSGQLPTG